MTGLCKNFSTYFDNLPHLFGHGRCFCDGYKPLLPHKNLFRLMVVAIPKCSRQPFPTISDFNAWSPKPKRYLNSRHQLISSESAGGRSRSYELATFDRSLPSIFDCSANPRDFHGFWRGDSIKLWTLGSLKFCIFVDLVKYREAAQS